MSIHCLGLFERYDSTKDIKREIKSKKITLTIITTSIVTIARTFALFDLIQIKAASCGAFHILPDVVMCIVSIVGTSFTCSKYKRQQNYDDDTIDVLVFHNLLLIQLGLFNPLVLLCVVTHQTLFVQFFFWKFVRIHDWTAISR